MLHFTPAFGQFLTETDIHLQDFSLYAPLQIMIGNRRSGWMEGNQLEKDSSLVKLSAVFSTRMEKDARILKQKVTRVTLYDFLYPLNNTVRPWFFRNSFWEAAGAPDLDLFFL